MKARHRRRRADRGVLLRLLSTLVIFGCVVAALTMFFRVKVVEISGNVRYSAAQVQEAAAVADGDNLFFLNKYAMADRIVAELPYVVEAGISRDLPDTLMIRIRECGTPLAVLEGDGAWLISPSGKLVEYAADPAGYIPVRGCVLRDPVVGGQASTDPEGRGESLTALLSALEDTGMLEQVESVSLEDRSSIRVEYGGRFTILLPYGADYPYKLLAVAETLADGKIQENMTGTLDATKDDKVFFRPGSR